jgi:hypothetical protein
MALANISVAIRYANTADLPAATVDFVSTQTFPATFFTL